MVNLVAKGRNDYANMRRDPSQHAESGTRVVFRAYADSLESLLALVVQDGLSDAVRRSAFETWVSLRDLHTEIVGEMERLGLTLHVIESKLMEGP